LSPKEPGLTVITTHVNADFDALASMLAASLLYPGSVAAFPGSQEKSLRDFFVQSASYLLNLKRAKDINLDQISRLVLVDTRQRSRIGRFAELLNGRRPIEIHVFDHHPDSADDIKGHKEMVEEVGACTSLMVPLLLERGLELDAEKATLLALGIYEDTGSFTFSSTRPADLEAAAELVRRGADLNLVASMITRELDARQVGLLNDLLEHMERFRISGFEVVIASCSSESYSPDFAVVSHKLMDMENLTVLFALARMDDRIHLVARSRVSEVDVGQLAEALGGGGHPSAASATIKGQTLIEARDRILRLLETQVIPQRTAQEIMSFPLISVSPDSTISEAHEILARYNINVLLVMDGERLVGLISRQVVEKSIFLGLKDLAVSEYTNPEFVTISPEANLSEIQDRIVDQRQRILPVAEDGRILGVVTRTDLLNILMSQPANADSLDKPSRTRDFVHKKSVKSLMSERLPKEILELLANIGRVGDQMKFNVYAVGGFIRDLLLRRENLDIDIVVEGDGIAFARRFAEQFPARVRPHEKFNTAVLVLADGFKLDVATARLEYYESPAAIPIIELSSLKLDLYRRDFTVNTLAVKLNQDQFGVLIDYFGAQRDLKEKTIRVLHSLSLVEDPTRALRAIRFEQRFGFKVGRLTANLIENAVRINAFSRVQPARLAAELIHILEEDNPAGALRRMNDFLLWPAVYPGLAYDEASDNLVHQIHVVLSWYGLLYLPKRFTPWVVYFLAVVDRLKDRELNELLDRLGLLEKYRLLILEARSWARRILRVLKRVPQMRRSSLYHLLTQSPQEGLFFAMAKGEEANIRPAFSLYFTELIKIKPRLNGHSLQAMGYRPGPQFKKMLDGLRDARLNGQVKTLDDERAFVARRFKRSGEE